MMFWWIYAYNLRLPMAIACVFGIAVCVGVSIWSAQVRGRTKFAEPENNDAKWRQHMALQAGIILVLVTILIWAIPSPQYDIRYVDRPVDRVVKVPVKVYSGIKEVPSNYQNVYDKCIDSYDYRADRDVMTQCHGQAMAAITPPPTVVTKTVVRFNAYKDLYNDCIGSWGISEDDKTATVSPAMIRNQRIEICTNAALAGSKAH
jgi:hypothetical protein